jgi:hypothetical protein
MRIRADRYAIASASARCPVCGQWTQVVALVAPEFHERSVEGGWEIVAERASLFYVTQLSAVVRHRLASLSPWYRQAHAGPQASFVNHCERCAHPLEDHDLHCEPGGAFQPQTPADARGIAVWSIDEALDAEAGGVGHDPAF